MSIELGHGNLLAADVDALVNTVNTEGVMGKGLALQFKKAFPENFVSYERACKAGEVVTGRMHVVKRLASPRFIINFPTKKHGGTRPSSSTSATACAIWSPKCVRSASSLSRYHRWAAATAVSTGAT